MSRHRFCLLGTGIADDANTRGHEVNAAASENAGRESGTAKFALARRTFLFGINSHVGHRTRLQGTKRRASLRPTRSTKVAHQRREDSHWRSSHPTVLGDRAAARRATRCRAGALRLRDDYWSIVIDRFFTLVE